MEDNLRTIKYSIQNQYFKYHIKKSEFKKGSLISKKKHPVIGVEQFKEELKKKKLIKDYDKNYFILKKTIITGGLMAYNLFSGELKTEFEVDYPIVINHNDIKIREEFGIDNIYSTDSIIHNNVNINAFKLKAISELEMNYDFINEHNPNEFMPIEEVIKNQLIKYSFIDSNARHGNANEKECDIVDEKNNIQVEVVTEFKNRLKKDKTPQKNMEMMVVECVNNSLIKTSDALLNKFIKKTYTDRYDKQLAIFCIGTREAIATMMEKLLDKLKENVIKNDFKKIYVLFYDLVSEKYYWYPDDKNGVSLVKDISEQITYKKKIKYSDMLDGHKYLIECKNIFKKETMVTYLKKEEIIDFVNKMKIII